MQQRGESFAPVTNAPLAHTLPGENTYELLELVGDSIIQLAATEMLLRDDPGPYSDTRVDQDAPTYEVGTCVRLRQGMVCREQLVEVAETHLDLRNHLLTLAKFPHQLSDRVVCDVFEAIIGAVYEDARRRPVKGRAPRQGRDQFALSSIGFATAGRVFSQLYLELEDGKALYHRDALRSRVKGGSELVGEVPAAYIPKEELERVGEEYNSKMQVPLRSANWRNALSEYVILAWRVYRRDSEKNENRDDDDDEDRNGPLRRKEAVKGTNPVQQNFWHYNLVFSKPKWVSQKAGSTWFQVRVTIRLPPGTVVNTLDDGDPMAVHDTCSTMSKNFVELSGVGESTNQKAARMNACLRMLKRIPIAISFGDDVK